MTQSEWTDEAPSDRRNLVSETADRLRDMVFALPEGALAGSLRDLAKQLGVGIVTLQKAAQVLEHEGLLEGRRGPGGGYYGTRPDGAAIARSIAAYVRANPTSFEEAIDITSLLFNELVPAAAGCNDPALRAELRALADSIDACDTETLRGEFEKAFQDLLFRMVERPLFKLLTLVTLQVSHEQPRNILRHDAEAEAQWKQGRHRIVAAILQQDAALARFEANRSNRDVVLDGMRRR
jgi:GntR family transcriptional repressor for pyruvate dehydrogenase complex